MLIRRLRFLSSLALVLSALLVPLPRAYSQDDEVPRLIQRLDHPDPRIRTESVTALGNSRDNRAVKPILHALEDKDITVRKAADQALTSITRDVSPVEILIEALKNEYFIIRRVAARALGETGDDRAIKPLIELLKDENPNVRAAAEYALHNLIIKVREAVEPLVTALKDEDRYVRRVCTEGLSEIDDTRAVEPLISALEDETRGVREAAAISLGEVKDARSVKSLLAALEDENPSVRTAAKNALCQITGPRAVEPLIAALQNRPPRVRQTVAEILGKTKDPRAVEPLVLSLRDRDLSVRVTAAKSLREIGGYPPRAFWSRTHRALAPTLGYDLARSALEINLTAGLYTEKHFVAPLAPRYRSHAWTAAFDISGAAGAGYSYNFLKRYTQKTPLFAPFLSDPAWTLGFGSRVYYSWNARSSFNQTGFFCLPALSLGFAFLSGPGIYLQTGPVLEGRKFAFSSYSFQAGVSFLLPSLHFFSPPANPPARLPETGRRLD